METFDPFKVLGLARRFDLDAPEVERSYLARSASLHPDTLGGLEGDSCEGAAELNRAKQILSDPEQRAVALWRLWVGGERAGGDDKALPPGFLMEMMEVREEIEGTRDESSRARWGEWAQKRREEYTQRVGAMFAALKPGAPENTDTLRRIKLELNAWRYIERLVEQLE